MKKIISVLGAIGLSVLPTIGQNTTVDFSSLYNNTQSLGASVTEKGFTFFGDDNNDGIQSGDDLFYTKSSDQGGIQANDLSFSSSAYLVVKRPSAFDFVQVNIEEPNGGFFNMEINGYLNGIKVTTKTFTLSSGANETITFDNTFNNVDEVRITGTDGLGVQQLFDQFVFGPIVTTLPGELLFVGKFEDGINKEGDSDSTAITLNQEPTSEVVILVSSLNNKTSFNKDTLRFDETNWNIAQNVIATAIDNKVDENTNAKDTITISVIDAISADEFDGLSNSTVIEIANDDEAGVLITQSNDTTILYESGVVDTVYINLESMPISDQVFLSFGTSSTNIELSNEFIVIESNKWDSTYYTILTSLNNSKVGNETFDLSVELVANGDDNYDGFTKEVQGVVISDDTASFTINQLNDSTITSSMGTKDSIYVQLLAEPQDDEVIIATITLSADNQVNLSTTSITIDTSNWNQSHLIVLEGLENMADSTFTLYTELSSSTVSEFDKLRDSISVTNKYVDPLALFTTNKVNEVKAYPIPANNKLTVEANRELLQVTCKTLNGNTVEVNSTIESNKATINTSSLESGMYLIQLETIDNKFLSKKVIIE